MSGKAPPTGPRALLNSLNGGPSKRHPPQSDLSSSSPHPSSSSPPSQTIPLINRIGAAPPTGPRSLLNGNTQGRTAKSALNGHTNPLTGQSRQPPSGPSAMQQKVSHKGKQVEIKWSDQAIASTSRSSLLEPGPSFSAARSTPLAAPNLNGKSSSGWSSSFSTIAQPAPPPGPRTPAPSSSNRERQPPQPSEPRLHHRLPHHPHHPTILHTTSTSTV
ncbi:hypothetical protein BGY98DRAFT_1101126 [Russula aff. rugulosa BPL654]|nr:hypothetical protein BGY98DRAFT_1101126 [Russula aff. rugulosa BPL654]